jgi:cell fate regulator YaaT (PSP1 superfamily)
MKKVIGIRFKPAGKVYDFDCGAFVLNKGDDVIVETERGLGFGSVAVPPVPIKDAPPPKKPLKKVYRLASDKDYQQIEKNAATEKKAYAYCLKSIDELKLKMNLFSVESTFDASKLTFFFTSDGRIDFRQLVKMLVKHLGSRIEMRQVGIRNQAKMCGGIGRCGREICCSAYMERFGPVSIRMAKEQGLSLNPTKISGQCGRLMCCLTFEFATYKELKKQFPKIGKKITTPEGSGKVIRHNAIRDRVAIRLQDGREVEFSSEQLSQSKNAIEPETGQSDNGQPETGQPDNKRSDNKRSDNRRSNNRRPDNKRSDNRQPDNRRSDSKRPDNKRSENKRSEKDTPR